MKDLGPLSGLTVAGGETLVARQVRLIREEFPACQISFVGGYEFETAFEGLPPKILAVENELHEDYAVGRSIELGLRLCVRPRVLILYGDLFFKESLFTGLPRTGSSIFLAELGPKEVGVNMGPDKARLFNYSIASPKWAQVAIFDGQELHILREMIPNFRDKLGHEIISAIIRKGGKFRGHGVSTKVFDIDNRNDLELAQRGAV